MKVSKLNKSFFGLRSGNGNTESQTDKVIPTGRSPLDTFVPPRSYIVLCQDFIMTPNTLSSTKCTLTISETINLKIPV